MKTNKALGCLLAAPLTLWASEQPRFDPVVQRAQVQSQLRRQPKDWQLVYFYVPASLDEKALLELQIRFINELIERQRAAQEKE